MGRLIIVTRVVLFLTGGQREGSWVYGCSILAVKGVAALRFDSTWAAALQSLLLRCFCRCRCVWWGCCVHVMCVAMSFSVAHVLRSRGMCGRCLFARRVFWVRLVSGLGRVWVRYVGRGGCACRACGRLACRLRGGVARSGLQI